ncbi:hypothetical protein AVA65_07965 [Salmonella enterica subsp. enterica serovar Minnesota]|nr:hypothetical protein [Salmonella enterica subsp. enterica serovar Minnesota]
MQNPSMSLEGKELVFNWEHDAKPVSFRIEQAKFIQLVCKQCHARLPLVDVSTAYQCSCGAEIQPDGLNHRAEDYGRWVSYLGKWRCKDNYQILLKDGRIIDYCYPNGGSWYVKDPKRNPEGTEHRFEDNDVVAIRQIPDNEIHNRFEFSGKCRLERNVDYFGDAFPTQDRVINLAGQYGILV